MLPNPSAKCSFKQECIPVGCVPSAALAVCCGGGVSVQGVSALGGCLPRGDGGVCLPGGICPGVSAWGCLPRGASAPVHAGIHPPVNRMTDRRLWKYYLAATSLRTVMNSRFTMKCESVLPIMLLNRSCAADPDTMKKSDINRYSLQQLSSKA